MLNSQSSLLHPPFFLLQVHPPAGTHLAVYCSSHGFFILLQHMAIQTPLNYGDRSSFYKIRILLYSTSFIGPRKLDSSCFLQFRYRVLALPLLHGTVAEAITFPLSGGSCSHSFGPQKLLLYLSLILSLSSSRLPWLPCY